MMTGIHAAANWYEQNAHLERDRPLHCQLEFCVMENHEELSACLDQLKLSNYSTHIYT